MNKILTTMLILLVAIPAFAQTYTVERVIDGNTLKLTNGEEVRLIGLKAPEDEKMGQEAKEFVREARGIQGLFLKGKEVLLKFDVEERDKYGRLLAYVFVDTGLTINDAIDMIIADIHHYDYYDEKYMHFINATIIKAGYATPMTIPPNVKYAELFQGLYEEARAHERGLWKKTKENLFIVILPEELVCEDDEGCTLIKDDCTISPTCQCADTAVNIMNKQKYERLFEECVEPLGTAQCKTFCKFNESKCVDGRCVAKNTYPIM